MRKAFEVRVSTTTGLVVIGAVLALLVGFVVWTLAGQADSDKAFAANVLTSLVDAQRREAGRNRHAELCEQFLGLIFMDVHPAALAITEVAEA